MASSYRIHDWLQLSRQVRAGLSATDVCGLAAMVLQILQTHAPEVAALTPAACWDDRSQEAVQAALRARYPDTRRQDIGWNLVCNVISRGRYAGLWDHVPWPRRHRVLVAPSALKGRDLIALRRATDRVRQLVEDLPVLLKSHDRLLVAGAAVAATALLGGLLQPMLLEQVLDPDRNLQRHGRLAWMTFELGRAPSESRDADVDYEDDGGDDEGVDATWEDDEEELRPRSVRRWFPDPVSLVLLHRLRELQGQSPASRGTPALTPDPALRVLAARYGWPDTSLSQLARDAKARWATRLTSSMLGYAINPEIAPSLPDTAWTRLVTGRPLPKHQAPTPARRASAEYAQAQASRFGPAIMPSLDGFAQHEAIRALQRVFRRGKRAPRLKKSEMKARLQVWQGQYDTLGGWVWLLGQWAWHVLCCWKNRRASKQGGSRLGPRGLLRYLEGFAAAFVEAFRDLPPDRVQDDPDAFAERFESLRRALLHYSSVSVARTGLVRFLRFVAHIGGPSIDLDSTWESVRSYHHVDANLLTPAEYIRLLAWLSRCKASAYEIARARVMTILGYRIGLRWEELSTLRLCDVRLTREPEPRGIVRIRMHRFLVGKSRSANRKPAIEALLSVAERKELAIYRDLAAKLPGSPRRVDDPLFADVDALDRPPRARDTHDLIQAGMRLVSGDPSLVFHHLRHSAANCMFLRLFLEPTGDTQALAWLPHAEAVSTSGLGFVGPYLTALCGRHPLDPSAAYVLPAMLGHLDPSEAMRSYVHLADFALHRAVCHHLSIPARVQADLDGISLASLRRRRHRDRLSPQRSQRNA